MKHLNFLLGTALAICSLTAQARSLGGEVGNGGNPNEIKFKSVALNIEQWIESGNADEISLPGTVPLSLYKSEMLKALKDFQIEFTEKLVRVGGAEKACRNYVESGRNLIQCNEAAFAGIYARSPDETYQIVHHEFAGLAGLETSDGSNSNYAISSQISAFLRTELVKRLLVLPREDASMRWLPASGWRSENLAGNERPALSPFILDQNSPTSFLPANAKNPYAARVTLLENGIAMAVEGPGSRLVEVSSNRRTSVQRKNSQVSFEVIVDRIPNLAANSSCGYKCTLLETGEMISIPPGSGAVEFPSQKAKSPATGKLIVTPVRDSIYFSQFSPEQVGGRTEFTKTVVNIMRATEWMNIKFSALGSTSPLSLSCEIDHSR